MTGPKTSSWATVMSLLTFVSNVGSTYQPLSRCSGALPPVATVAPSSTAFSTKPSTRSRCASEISGPTIVSSS